MRVSRAIGHIVTLYLSIEMLCIKRLIKRSEPKRYTIHQMLHLIVNTLVTELISLYRINNVIRNVNRYNMFST